MDIVFFRKTYAESGPFDVSHAIKCAKKWSPNSRVVLIGDEHQPTDLCDFLPMKDYSDAVNQFKEVFRYPIKQEYWYNFVTTCQWMTLVDYCNKNKVSRVFAPDTDILLYDDINEAEKPFAKYDFTVSAPTGSPQCPMIINNPNVLNDFLKFLLELYSSEKADDIALIESGVDSMRLWNLFHKAHSFYTRGDTSIIVNNSTIDHNLAMPYHGYDYDEGGKVMRWVNGQPFCARKTEDGKEMIRFVLLHMWGKFKNRMAEFIEKSELSITK